MHALILLLWLATVPSTALAVCPGSDCAAGGGPATTDCFVAWSGTTTTNVTCTDGDACDGDGTVDGVCTFAIQACINVSGLGTCTAATLDGPPTVKPVKDDAGTALAAALTALDPATASCTPPGIPLPVKLSIGGIKPGKTRLTVTASSSGKKDRDKLRLTCMPSSAGPSFAHAVQPIFDQRCAYSGCHDASSGPLSGTLVLASGSAYGDVVGKPSLLGKQPRVQPGSIRGSQLAHRVLGRGIPRGGTEMPQGCPGFPPANGCLTDQETFTILGWIAAGARND
ncbi:MAG TPA: hypothetical protein VKA21_06670 [Candidatus Binatia bacterium]|nr:hypothetical protein [Candidatus Binatia bacterium]